MILHRYASLLFDYLQFFRENNDHANVGRDMYSGAQGGGDVNAELSLFLLVCVEFWLKQTPPREARTKTRRKLFLGGWMDIYMCVCVVVNYVSFFSFD